MNLNRVFILGNVTQVPEVRTLPSGQPVVSFGIATNRFYTDTTGAKKQDAEFHNIVAFGKLADICSRYLNKGSLLLVEGRLKTRNWQNSSGVKQYKTEIIANSIQLGPKPAGAENIYPKQNQVKNIQEEIREKEIPIIEEGYTPPAPGATNEKPNQGSAKDDDTDEIDIRDIPF